MEVDIAYIVSHGFAARMVTQTNLLGLLAEEGKKVALICPDGNDENLKSYCYDKGVSLIEFNPKSGFWTSQYAELRKYFLEDIEHNTALLEKHIWATQFNFSGSILSKIRPRIGFLGYKLTKLFPAIRKWYKSWEDIKLRSNDAYSLIHSIKPKILVSTYPVNFLEAMLLKVANELKGCKTVIHLLSWDNITCKGRFPQLADEYIAWGPVMKEELIEYYNVPDHKIHVCGVPHFDIHIQNRKNNNYKGHLMDLGLNPDYPYIFFGMSSPRFAPAEIDIVEWLAKEISKGNLGINMQLIVRPHPQNVQGSMSDQNWIPRLMAVQTNYVKIDLPELVYSKLPWSMKERDMIRMSEILSGSKICINSGSTLIIDSLMCNVPVIITAFDGHKEIIFWKSSRRLIEYPHLKKVISFGGISVAGKFDELAEEIVKYLSDPLYKYEQRKSTLERQICEPDISATDKVYFTLNI